MTVESLRSSRVLVVEDESLIAEEIKDRLERMGACVVAMVSSGEEAVLRAGELHPNIILMDIRLRGSIDGIEAAQRISALHQIPVVYLTAHADDATLSRAKRTAPYGYLLKPFAERDLRIVLEMALYKHSAEAELHQSRELYATTLAGIIEGVIAANDKSCITFMNPAAERLTQWAAPDAKGRGVSEILSILNSKTRDEIQGLMDQVLSSGEPMTMDDVILVDRKGREVPVFDSIAPIRDAENRVKGAVLVLRDLTEQKVNAEALRAADLRVQRMQKMDAIGRLAGGIAHDVGNMMMIVRGNGELILEQLTTNDPCRQRLEAMLHAADRSSALARQLLAFSRKQPFTTVPVDLNEIVETMRPMLRALLSAEIQIEARLSNNLSLVQADRAQIEQILMNLSINSRDAMPSGGTLKFETFNMSVGQEAASFPELKPGPYAVLTVTDTGCGMSEEVKSHLFEPFYTTKDIGKGTGLGLATVFGIVTQFNGRIDVSSATGRGTTIRIYLPATRSRGGTAASDNSTNQDSDTILLVEDEPELRELVINFLTSQNYRVLAAADGEEALTLAQDELEKINLLLTDAIMPRMSGIVLADRLCSLRPELKVIFMSGYTEDCLTDRKNLKGGTAFIQKPFSKAELLRAVAEMLQKKK